MTHRIVVLGGGYAGVVAARRLADRLADQGAGQGAGQGEGQGAGRDATSEEVAVTLVNASDRFVERVRLHQLGAGQALRDIPLREVVKGVRLVVARVTAIDLAARAVRTKDGQEIPYDTLVHALGSRGGTAGVPGVAEHAFRIGNLDDAQALSRRLAELRGNDAKSGILVVGGGLTGIETAAELAGSGPAALDVELVTAGAVGGRLAPRARAHLRRAFDRLGLRVRENTQVAKVADGEVLFGGGEAVRYDAIVWAAGFEMSPLAAEAGLAVDADGRVLVDATLRSVSHPDVYAAGDAAALESGATRPSCQAAIPMGFQAAENIVARLDGRSPRRFRLRYVGQCVSLGRHDALLQLTRTDDTPIRAVLTGRAVVPVKEAVLRSTVMALSRPALTKAIGTNASRR